MHSGVHTYDYDWQGNRLSATNGATGAVYAPDGLNQYDAVDDVEPVYDLDGNLLEIPGRMAMAYDAKNQMTFCSNASYRVWNTYDHLGRRIVKETQYQNGTPSARHYLYDGWNMIAETLPSGAPNHYLWGLDLSGTEQGGVGGLLGYLRGTTWFIALYDGNGNVTGYVNADLGRAVISYEFDAFGKMTSGNPTGIFRFRFSTKYYDTETGLYYYGRRFYDPVWGRWLNRDPIEEAGGLNLYGFCGNDGVNGVDALGLNRSNPTVIVDCRQGYPNVIKGSLKNFLGSVFPYLSDEKFYRYVAESLRYSYDNYIESGFAIFGLGRYSDLTQDPEAKAKSKIALEKTAKDFENIRAKYDARLKEIDVLNL